MLAIVSIAASLLTVGAGAAATQMQAAAAADLAALRAADLLQHRHTAAQACNAAAALATTNAVRMSSCHVTGDVVVVRVIARAPRVIGGHVHARARAGPV